MTGKPMVDELDMLAQTSPEIGKVVGLLKELAADEAIRMQPITTKTTRITPVAA
jgi:hypothetical protein